MLRNILILFFLSSNSLAIAQTSNFVPKQGTVKQNLTNKKSESNSQTAFNYNFLKDYEHMSDQVKAKINYNKLNGLKLSEGVCKQFKANIKSCSSIEATNKLFSFLKSSEGYISTRFISNGIVQFIVVPELNSEDLKERLLVNKIKFNFLSEEYLLK